jgi:5-methylthioadenosine/S-adenosylhomocysteine deaminase
VEEDTFFHLLDKKFLGDDTMKTLLRNGKLLTLNHKDEYFENADVLICDDRIEKIDKKINLDYEIDKVIDCDGKLIMPGLINSHFHSDETFFKASYDNLPLEIWRLYSCPPMAYGPFAERLTYLRTMLGAIELVKAGITCVQDDVSDYPNPTVEGYSAICSAYEEIGMRANVSMSACDKEMCDHLPYARNIIPKEFQEKLAGSMRSEDIIDLYHEIIEKWNNHSNIKVILSTSAPQRCSDKHLLAIEKLSKEKNLPVHTHVLETRMQRVTGGEFYNKSIIKHIAELGIMSERLTIAHSVWVDDEDIELMSKSGVSVAHNPISNLKLGSGIAPLIKLLDAGVNVVLGTDGMNSNDELSIFEAMKFAALLPKVTNPDYRKWPSSSDIMKLAVNNPAKSLMRTDEIGCLDEGKKADIIILNLKNNTLFTPFNELKNHLVYCENGSSVETVISNGKVIMENKKLLTINEENILNEINTAMIEFKENLEKTKSENLKLFNYMEEIYWKGINQRLDISRFCSKTFW